MNFRMRKTAFLFAAVGLALFLFLIIREGFGDIAGAMALAGWSILWIPLLRLLPIGIV